MAVRLAVLFTTNQGQNFVCDSGSSYMANSGVPINVRGDLLAKNWSKTIFLPKIFSPGFERKPKSK